jgi:pimeloyl-ACP methyl ester carboxylesterase
MKSILTFFFLSFIFPAFTFCQQNDYQCLCSKIGLKDTWADMAKVSCYLIPVDRDISKPSSSKFYLAAVVVSALTEKKVPPLLYLHGGPGIATLENVPKYLQSKTWKTLRENQSLVFFDYRGTGYSEPALCPQLKDSLLSFSKTNPSPKQKKTYEASIYKKCKEQHLNEGIDITSFSAKQLAADADLIRKSLKITYWNVYGVSFGTTVALNMIRNHSKHIKAVILDSPFPTNAPWLDFVRPFDTCFQILVKNIDSYPLTASIFPTLRSDYVKAVQRLNNEPAKIKNGFFSFDLSGDDFAWGIWNAMLSPKSIPFVPIAIKEIANGNDSILPKWITAFYQPNSFGTRSQTQSNAIMCFEGRPRDEAGKEASLRLNYPDFDSFISAFDEEVCNEWRPDIAGAEVFAPVVSDVPVLILSGEYDPVCPPLFGDITAATLSKAIHIVVPAASHAAIHADDCIRDIAINFLMNPNKKPNEKCVGERKKINFITADIMQALNNLKN